VTELEFIGGLEVEKCNFSHSSLIKNLTAPQKWTRLSKYLLRGKRLVNVKFCMFILQLYITHKQKKLFKITGNLSNLRKILICGVSFIQ